MRHAWLTARKANARLPLDGAGQTSLPRPGLVFAAALLFAVATAWSHPLQTTSSLADTALRERLDEGRELLAQGKLADAAQVFRELLKTVPNSALLYNLLGFCDLEQGNTDSAVSNFKRAVALKPDYKAPHNNLGGIYLVHGHIADAIREFQEVVRIDPRDAQGNYNLARAELALKRNAPATEHLRRAYDLSPESVPITLALAQLDLDMNHKELGRPMAQKLAQAFPPDSAAEIEVGALLLQYDLDEAAVAHFKNAQQFDPRAQKTLYALGVDQFNRQHYKAALTLLEAVGPAAQSSSQWHELVGESYFKLGNPKRGFVEVQNAVQIDPHNENCVLELGEILLNQNNAPAAATLFEAATKVQPNAARIWFGLGAAYLSAAHLAPAESALKKSLDLDPKLEPAYVLLGEVYGESSQWKKLGQIARDLLTLNPRSAKGYYYQALALERTESPGEIVPGPKSPLPGPHQGSGPSKLDEQVLKLLRQSVKLDPGDPEPRYKLAKALVEGGQQHAAIEELQQITRIRPEYGPAHYMLARLYREKGDLREAEQEQRAHDVIAKKIENQVFIEMLVRIHQQPSAGGEKH